MYHRYKVCWHILQEDVVLMKKIGLDAFRFSISWSRILPKGKISGGVNQLGVKFYNNLIDELLANGLQPYVTLFHWDLPQALEDEYGGFLSPKIVDDYRNYVDFCFKTFGNRVKHWFTLNEPYAYTLFGYTTGTFAPGRCSSYAGNCSSGNSATEPYIVAHHLILSHAAGVKLYREKYKPYQKGQIGVTLVTHWFVPISQSTTSRKAAQRAIDFMLGWFLHPMTYGDYPHIMRSLVGNRLPKFTDWQSKMLQKSYDFLGVNYYTSNYASNVMFSNSVNLSMFTDNRANMTTVKNGIPIGQPTDLNWLYIYPKGIRSLMLYIKDKYGNPPIYITENGIAEANNNTLPIKEALKDKVRILYHYGHLSHLSKAIKEGADLKGYFLWSFLDDFEWDAGFTVRFGINYVDFKNGLKRYPKYSAFWFKKFLKMK
ncbi:vicianin hydrolase-like isoform X2 [Cornus florida]|uniref:vicianin hydrolase-like isoform X2 n=1 Tax=Cornus florida TaxID=4283 RepID=UPI0028A1FA98|nr:vicianin hydrolase-like isoform X2 [Cornus florida]